MAMRAPNYTAVPTDYDTKLQYVVNYLMSLPTPPSSPEPQESDICEWFQRCRLSNKPVRHGSFVAPRVSGKMVRHVPARLPEIQKRVRPISSMRPITRVSQATDLSRRAPESALNADRSAKPVIRVDQLVEPPAPEYTPESARNTYHPAESVVRVDQLLDSTPASPCIPKSARNTYNPAPPVVRVDQILDTRHNPECAVSADCSAVPVIRVDQLVDSAPAPPCIPELARDTCYPAEPVVRVDQNLETSRRVSKSAVDADHPVLVNLPPFEALKPARKRKSRHKPTLTPMLPADDDRVGLNIMLEQDGLTTGDFGHTLIRQLSESAYFQADMFLSGIPPPESRFSAVWMREIPERPREHIPTAATPNSKPWLKSVLKKRAPSESPERGRTNKLALLRKSLSSTALRANPTPRVVSTGSAGSLEIQQIRELDSAEVAARYAEYLRERKRERHFLHTQAKCAYSHCQTSQCLCRT